MSHQLWALQNWLQGVAGKPATYHMLSRWTCVFRFILFYEGDLCQNQRWMMTLKILFYPENYFHLSLLQFDIIISTRIKSLGLSFSKPIKWGWMRPKVECSWETPGELVVTYADSRPSPLPLHPTPPHPTPANTHTTCSEAEVYMWDTGLRSKASRPGPEMKLRSNEP